MPTYKQLNDQLSKVLTNGDSLVELKTTFDLEIRRISEFMTMFLDRFGNKIVEENDNSPEWKVYTTKTAEYNNYARVIRNTEYFIARKKYES